ncbi:hypothetical protein H5410_010865 [Solanum commersonii]|uniref:Uncharacterized protein n=1 Tax=Solanum commersonii TaxID=4109 RepID=A0A9J6ANK9_SOLCO|nr:hypothetical protein H5410_010865 [Solanum commersonii]
MENQGENSIRDKVLVEHEVLERERGRLRALYQQQHQQPQPQPQQQKPSYSHRRSTSRDLDQQFANLTLKQKEAERDALTLPWSDKSSRFPLCDIKKRSCFPCAHLQRPNMDTKLGLANPNPTLPNI